MSTIRNLRPVLAALAAAAALAGAGGVWAAPLPPVQTQGAVSFVTGGVGKDAAHAFEAAAKHWPAMLEFAVKSRPHDAFLANVKVTVRDAKGQAVLDTTSDGPFLLARLQPGSYQVKATYDGKTVERALHVKAGTPTREVFVWPASELKKEG